ncbi:GNAT family N-acetyltransferase [Exiguobacterium indicum]|uniref:GNAT family N-acetyltransferase n=1 Tax=Exiguobacterium indicum TaxID=296995 RepID=UPI002B257D96|nr:GNAT family N-acetyltransferase [Exiguobacterium indicum]
MIQFQGSPALHTERLRLRKVQLSDTEAMFQNWLSDDRVMRHLIKGPHETMAQTKARVTEVLASYEEKTFCYWGIEEKHSGTLIGVIDLFAFDATTDHCEVGYCIGYDWWNNGYGSEALTAVLAFGFQEMHIHKISAAHNIDNPASGRIMQKVGMIQEGTVRAMIRNAAGEYKDCAIYGLLREAYDMKKNL